MGWETEQRQTTVEQEVSAAEKLSRRDYNQWVASPELAEGYHPKDTGPGVQAVKDWMNNEAQYARRSPHTDGEGEWIGPIISDSHRVYEVVLVGDHCLRYDVTQPNDQTWVGKALTKLHDRPGDWSVRKSRKKHGNRRH